MDKFKPSSYNLRFLSQEPMYVFNTRTGSLVKLDKKTSDILESGEYVDKESIDNFDTLLGQGIIVPSEVDEISEIVMMQRKCAYSEYESILSLVIAPTLDCNYECFYCFENNTKRQGSMSKSVEQGILQFVENEISRNPRIEKIRIKWFGGEPLLELTVIKSISEGIHELIGDRNIAYFASVVTNGLLLTPSKQRILREKCYVNDIQITLDGMEEEYCKRKKATTNDFHKVIDNITTASETLNLSIRMNIDRSNYNGILRITEELLISRKLLGKISIYPAPIIIDEKFSDCSDSNCYKNGEFEEVRLKFIDFLNEAGDIRSIKSRLPVRMIVSCSMVNENSFCIGPNGDLYKCEQVIGIDEYAVGTVFGSKRYSKVEMNMRLLDLDSVCRECVLLPTCMGGCPFKRISDKYSCDMRQRIEVVKKSLCKIVERRGVNETR